MTVNAVLVSVQPGAKKANDVAGDSAALMEEEGQLFAAVLGQWLYALEGTQGQKFMDIVPAGKEANSGIVTGGQEGTIPLLMAGGFAQTGMDRQTSTGTGSELDKYKEQIIKLLEELNGEIVIPRQGVKAGFPNQTQEVQSKLLAQAFNLLQVQNPGLADASSVIEPRDAPALKSLSIGDTGGIGKDVPVNSEPLRDEVSAVSHARGQELKLNPGALSEPSQVSGVINKSLEEAKGINAQPNNLKEHTWSLVPEQQVQNGVLVVRPQTGERRALKGYGFKNPAGEFDQDLKITGGGQVLGENKLGSGKIQANLASDQAEPTEGMTDNRPQSGMPHLHAAEQNSLEASPNFGESHTGIAGSNSARLNIGTQALNANNGFLPVWEQIAQTVREHRNRPEVEELQLQLHPAELGKIKVFLHWQDGQVNLQVQASESATGTLVQHSLSDLRQALEQAGVSCGLLQSGLSGGNRQQPETEFSAPAFARQRQDEQDKVFLPEQAYMPADLGGRINYMA